MSQVNVSGGVTFTGLLGLLFIGLKLGGVITWPWLWVLSPLWIPVATAMLLLAAIIAVATVTAVAAGGFRKWCLLGLIGLGLAASQGCTQTQTTSRVGTFQAVGIGGGQVYQLDTRDGSAYVVSPEGTLFLGVPQNPVSDPARERAGMPGHESGGLEIKFKKGHKSKTKA